MDDPNTRHIECPIAFNVTPTKDQEGTPAIHYELLIEGKPLDACSDEEVRDAQRKLHDFTLHVETAGNVFNWKPELSVVKS